MEFLQLASKFISETGGAIPLIVNNALHDNWTDQLESLVRQKLDVIGNVNDSVSKLSEIFGDRKIRIFGGQNKWPPFVSETAEGSVKWSLEESEFESDEPKPNIDKAELYIFIADIELLSIYLREKADFAPYLVGIIRVFIHEMINGMYMLKRLLDCQDSLTWSQNQNRDWCFRNAQFDMLVATPSKLGPAPKDNKPSSTSYPTDAGRTWEHSITAGKAFFQEGCKVMVSVNGRFDFSRLQGTEALEVLKSPCALIEISRRHVDEIEARVRSTVERYITVSGIACTFEYQCPGSARWLVDHIEEANAWRAASASARTEHGAEPVSGQRLSSTQVQDCLGRMPSSGVVLTVTSRCRRMTQDRRIEPVGWRMILRPVQRRCRIDSVVDRIGKWRRPPAGFAVRACIFRVCPVPKRDAGGRADSCALRQCESAVSSVCR